MFDYYKDRVRRESKQVHSDIPKLTSFLLYAKVMNNTRFFYVLMDNMES